MKAQSSRRALLLGASSAVGAVAIGKARPAFAAPTPLKVVSFSGISSAPILAAQQKNLFAKYDLAVELIFTPNSQSQREGLAKGESQIIHTAADNVVAMVENANADAIVVAGGDDGLNRIIVQPEINALADLRGKTVAVDAPNTAFALLLYKSLKEAGVNKGDYGINPVGGTPQRLKAMMTDKANAAAAVINLPLNFEAETAGLKDIGSANSGVGEYQAGCVAVMRPWAKANSDTLVRYIKATVEGRRWLLDPANKTETLALLREQFKLSAEYAAKTYAAITAPAGGFAKDAKFSTAGFENVLKLRAEIEGQWGGKPPASGKYVDLTYYETALAGL